MWTRIKHSLTLRIFLMTCGLMIAVCAATYGAIAYLTPLTYTSILQEDLDQKTEALLTALSGREPSACDELLSAFCRETGAALRLSDEYGRILYDTISSEAYLVEGTAERAAITTEESETLEQDAVMQATEAGDATGTAESVIHQITVTDAYISADEAQTFFFRDGTMGHLLVIGGKKAVNQLDLDMCGRVSRAADSWRLAADLVFLRQMDYPAHCGHQSYRRKHRLA